MKRTSRRAAPRHRSRSLLVAVSLSMVPIVYPVLHALSHLLLPLHHLRHHARLDAARKSIYIYIYTPPRSRVLVSSWTLCLLIYSIPPLFRRVLLTHAHATEARTYTRYVRTHTARRSHKLTRPSSSLRERDWQHNYRAAFFVDSFPSRENGKE